MECAALFNCATGLKYELPAANNRLDRHAAINFEQLLRSSSILPHSDRT